MKQPLVSVIIPMYNAEKYIFETIESVLNQTYKNWELIIVDDCSTDRSRDIVKEYIKQDDRIKLIESETNFGGPARPRNIGIEKAKGEFIAFLDADDVWLPEKLEKQLNFIQNTNVDICHTFANMINEKSEKIGFFDNQKLYNFFKFFFQDKSILFYTNYININTVLMRYDINIKFNEDKNLIALEDWKLWIDLSNDKKIGLLKEILINYRIVHNSISKRNSDLSYRKAIYMISKLLVTKKISLKHFFLSINYHFLKLIFKKVFSINK